MYYSYPNLLYFQTPHLSLTASDFIALATETLQANGSHLSTTKSKSMGENHHWPYPLQNNGGRVCSAPHPLKGISSHWWSVFHYLFTFRPDRYAIFSISSSQYPLCAASVTAFFSIGSLLSAQKMIEYPHQNLTNRNNKKNDKLAL